MRWRLDAEPGSFVECGSALSRAGSTGGSSASSGAAAPQLVHVGSCFAARDHAVLVLVGLHQAAQSSGYFLLGQPPISILVEGHHAIHCFIAGLRRLGIWGTESTATGGTGTESAGTSSTKIGLAGLLPLTNTG